MLNYDVIVCGAGPAGTTAAWMAAKTGLKVALIEKYPLPRHKTCGGGMPAVLGNLLPDLVPEAVVACQVNYMRHTWKFDHPILGAINPPGSEPELKLWMVQRSVFDNALARQAAQAGADLRDGLAVKSLEMDSHGVIVRARSFKSDSGIGGGEFVAYAPYVIGADGANGITAKIANLRRERTMALAMEVEYPYNWTQDHPKDLRPDVIHLEYGAVPNGYGWIFPKEDHLNVGAGLFRPDRRDCRSDHSIRAQLQQAIFQYLDFMDISYNPELVRFHGHPLPIWDGREKCHTPDGKILLAGDAAGLINPFFGDGILHAVKSGMLAAECVATNTTSSYTQRIHHEFAANFDAALQMARFYYQWPHFCYQQIVTRPTATHIAARLLYGETPFHQIAERMIGKMRSLMF